ncbi:adenylyl cyclase X E-like isoform X1 [Scaptodrosophila lebanonensis]|uniref:adenylate cyclase n=2 Tax=Drosophila lebanonensis TaxID=7225 RepID=A0A6J2T6N3_DROLE|nr:adenylyl cyclase X E-like isoform X1 [Scaptodrosophila lebanonensis]
MGTDEKIEEDFLDNASFNGEYISGERKLDWEVMRIKCSNLGLEKYYKRYDERVMVSNLALFQFIVVSIISFHIVCLLLGAVEHSLSLILYAAALFLVPVALFINFKDTKKDKRMPRWRVISSWVAALILTFMDIGVGLWISDYTGIVIPCYDHIVVISIYLFLPVRIVSRSIILGLAVSLLYFVHLIYVYWKAQRLQLTHLLGYAIYLLSLNLLSTIFPLLREFYMRQVLLGRRKLLQEKFLLSAAMENETALINTILPQLIADTLKEDIRKRIEKRGRRSSLWPVRRTLFVEPHSNVSILSADIMNYTALTTTMEVKELVIFLHDLFVRFDVAAEKNEVQRIKFLGDRYTCVASIPKPNPAHAKCCVDLGLEMISIVSAISERRQLIIDMRIGVNSGEIVAGVIGSIKWQYDIWSPDVDIAYRLSETGRIGKVHVTERTLMLLENEYLYSEGTERAKQDPVFVRDLIKTYLVSKMRDSVLDIQIEEYARRDIKGPLAKLSAGTIPLKTDLDMYNEIRFKTKSSMIEEVENMASGHAGFARIFDFSKNSKSSAEDNLFKSRVTAVFLLFRNGEEEWKFINVPDVLMKYTCFAAVVAGLMIFLKIATQDYTRIKHTKQLLLMLVVLFIIFVCAFFKKFWTMCSRVALWDLPTFFLWRWLYFVSDFIEQKLVVRLFLCFLISMILYLMATKQVMDCRYKAFELELIEAALSNTIPKDICFRPWAITHNIILVILITFCFFSMPLIFKLAVGLILIGAYIITINVTYDFAYERSETTNWFFRAEAGHTWYVVSIYLLLILKMRYNTFAKKFNYYMQLRFEDEQKRTENTNKSIRVLMANILPLHVWDMFLEKRRKNEFFYEQIDKVAVMFAQIVSVDVDRLGLRVLNEFICYFDDLLDQFQSRFKIEKIKVVGWTYMAACGLEVDRISDRSNTTIDDDDEDDNRSSVRFDMVLDKTTDDWFSDQRSLKPRQHKFLRPNDECVLVLTKFALELLRGSRELSAKNMFLENDRNIGGSLKIGISHGPVSAGVVGISKPHYDLWGHPVNLASEMSNTGVLDAIHVSERTAVVLRRYDIRCDYRGQTSCKSLGELPTYLVAVDESSNFMPNEDEDLYPGQFMDDNEDMEIVERLSVGSRDSLFLSPSDYILNIKSSEPGQTGSHLEDDTDYEEEKEFIQTLIPKSDSIYSITSKTLKTSSSFGKKTRSTLFHRKKDKRRLQMDTSNIVTQTLPDESMEPDENAHEEEEEQERETGSEKDKNRLSGGAPNFYLEDIEDNDSDA